MTEFRTFCHINDYGEAGFANLHRMIATSDPLYLWGPSTQLLTSPECRVTVTEFLRYVEKGRIRIVARRSWYDTTTKRREHPWAGARWNPEVDDSLAAIAKNDESLPDEERRVFFADDATGDENAAKLLELKPELVGELASELAGPDVRERFPPGALDSALRWRDDPAKMVRQLLAHAFNHGDAIELTGPRAPFLLDRRDGIFSQVLDGELASAVGLEVQKSQVGLPRVEGVRLEPTEMAALTAEVLSILTSIEERGKVRLSSFLGSPEQAALTAWIDQQILLASASEGGYAPGEPLRRLREELDEGQFASVKEMLLNLENAAGAAGVGLDLMAPDVDGVGLVLGLLPALHGGLKVLGQVPVDYHGVQWPYLYGFGRPSLVKRQKLRAALDALVVE